MSLSIQILNGSITIGKRVCAFHVTDAGELVFPTGSRAEALGIAEVIDRQINQSRPVEVASTPVPAIAMEAAARKSKSAKAEEKQAEPVPVKRGRGRPPKVRAGE